MNPQDMEQLAVSEGATIRVTSDRGSMQLAVQPDQSIARQTCFFPEHFNKPPVKDLMSVQVDPTTGVPTFKQTRVTIEKA
jgi:formate dehydrogenase alpha subunit